MQLKGSSIAFDDNPKKTIAGFILFFYGFSLLIIGTNIFNEINEYNVMANGISEIGTVSYVFKSGNNVFQSCQVNTVIDGVMVNFSYNYLPLFEHYTNNQHVIVKYLKDNPSSATIYASYWIRLSFYSITYTLGIIWATLGFFVIRKIRKRMKERAKYAIKNKN